jgi:hypothetical protein
VDARKLRKLCCGVHTVFPIKLGRLAFSKYYIYVVSVHSRVKSWTFWPIYQHILPQQINFPPSGTSQSNNVFWLYPLAIKALAVQMLLEGRLQLHICQTLGRLISRQFFD